MDRVITSHIYKQGGWIGLGRQELWTDPEHRSSHIPVETSFQAIHRILTAALDTLGWLHTLEPVGTTLVRSLPAMSAHPDKDISPTFQTLRQSLSAISSRPRSPRSRSRSVPERASPQLETNQGLQGAVLIAEAPLSAGETAFATLQYLPIPIVVLSSLKQVILVNEALKSFLATVDAEEDAAVSNGAFVQTVGAETLLGRSLSQIGIQMVTEGDRAATSLEV